MNATEATRKALARHSESGTLLDLLERQRPAIEKALPTAIGAERFARLVTTEIRRNPLLLECIPESVLGAMMLAAQLGLEPGPLGHAYLIPFKEQGKYVCQFVIGYKGYIELGYRSGRLGSLRTATVHEGDTFDYEERETGPYLRHRECPPSDRGKIVCYYSRATIIGGKPSVKRLWPEEIEAARKRSPLGRQNKGPWHTDYEAMAHKTCVRRHAATLPQSAILARALEVDERPVIELDPSGDVTIDAEAVETDKETEA